MDFVSLRRLFPVSQDWIFLDHASIASPPTPVSEAMNAFIDQRSRQAFSEELIQSWQDEVERVRAKVARFVGAQPQEILFTHSTSDGLNLAAQGLPLKEGDRVLISDLEYPANMAPWMNLASRGVNLQVMLNRDGRIEPRDIERALDARAKVLSICSVSPFNGFRVDLESISALCQERGVTLVVDAIQSIGCLRFDVNLPPADLVTWAAYKWLCGPFGLGICYVNENLFRRLRAPQVWWGNVRPCDHADWSDSVYPRTLRARQLSPPENAAYFEGAVDCASILGLEAAIDIWSEVGIDTIEERVLGLTDLLVKQVRGLGVEVVSPRGRMSSSGIVGLRIADATSFVERCGTNHLRVALRGGLLRVSPHCYNTEEDIERLVDLLKEHLASVEQRPMSAGPDSGRSTP